MKHGRNYKEALKKVDVEKNYGLDEGIKLVKSMACANFDETIEVAVNLRLKKSQSVRDTFVLPNQFAEGKRILVFAKGEKAREAEEAGAAFVGADDLVAKIKDGWMEFDVCVATPDMMKEVGKLGPILGRRGMMPNPKTRTVTMDIEGAIAELNQGRIEYRADKGGVVHLAVGKVSMDSALLRENVRALLVELDKKRLPDIKGDFIKSASLASTMSPGIRIQVQEQMGS